MPSAGDYIEFEWGQQGERFYGYIDSIEGVHWHRVILTERVNHDSPHMNHYIEDGVTFPLLEGEFTVIEKPTHIYDLIMEHT